MEKYLPSCNFTKALPEVSEKLKRYLESKGIEIEGCCRLAHKKFQPNDKVIAICQSCIAITHEVSPDIELVSLFEYLDHCDFNWPDYQGKKMVIQDCWRAKKKTSLQMSIRSLMKKMNMEIIELEDNYDQSEFCGTFRYNEMIGANKKIAPHYFIDYMRPHLQICDLDTQKRLLQDHAKKYLDYPVVCYCNACLRGINETKTQGFHILELLTRDL